MTGNELIKSNTPKIPKSLFMNAALYLLRLAVGFILNLALTKGKNKKRTKIKFKLLSSRCFDLNHVWLFVNVDWRRKFCYLMQLRFCLKFFFFRGIGRI